MSRAKYGDQGVFVELFAGTGKLSQSLRKRGFAVASFEVKSGHRFDLLDRRVQRFLRKCARSGIISGCWFGTP
eukprot:11572543-Karenia_brevis.AAC.1